MADTHCTRCGKAEKYMHAATGTRCQSCLNKAPKKCAGCGEHKPRKEFDTDDSKRDGKVSRCKSCFGYKRPHRIGAKQQRNRLLDSWHDAKAKSDVTLEEYADHWERSRMGCKPSDWAAWWESPPPAKPAPVDRDALRARADRLQRPVRDPNGKRVWPSDWGSSLRFTWQYANDEAFRAKQIERTQLRKYTMPSYGASVEKSPGNKRKWQRAADQMGKVTRAHIRREMRAKLCSYCLEPLTADNRHLDHIDPLCKGGAHDDRNIIASCAACNMSKGRKSLVGWLLAAG